MRRRPSLLVGIPCSICQLLLLLLIAVAACWPVAVVMDYCACSFFHTHLQLMPFLGLFLSTLSACIFANDMFAERGKCLLRLASLILSLTDLTDVFLSFMLKSMRLFVTVFFIYLNDVFITCVLRTLTSFHQTYIILMNVVIFSDPFLHKHAIWIAKFYNGFFFFQNCDLEN